MGREQTGKGKEEESFVRGERRPSREESRLCANQLEHICREDREHARSDVWIAKLSSLPHPWPRRPEPSRGARRRCHRTRPARRAMPSITRRRPARAFMSTSAPLRSEADKHERRGRGVSVSIDLTSGACGLYGERSTRSASVRMWMRWIRGARRRG
jgi:hypothetical protein